MPMNAAPWRAARAVVAVGLAVGGYVVFIPGKAVDHGKLGSLVISRTAMAGLPGKAPFGQWVDPSKSSFSTTKRAAKRDPDHTGLYAREWYVTSGAPPEVGVVLQLLPDTTTAAAVLGDISRQLGTAPQLSGEKAAPAEPFSLPGVPGGRGTAFALSDTAKPANGVVGYSYKTIFRFERAVVSELVVSSSPTRSTTAPVADAQAALRILQRREPGFSFVHQRVPVVASIVYAAVALVAVAALVVLPEWVLALRRRRLEHRREREQKRSREQYLARGRRNVKGQGAPPWARPKRR